MCLLRASPYCLYTWPYRRFIEGKGEDILVDVQPSGKSILSLYVSYRSCIEGKGEDILVTVLPSGKFIFSLFCVLIAVVLKARGEDILVDVLPSSKSIFSLVTYSHSTSCFPRLPVNASSCMYFLVTMKTV